MRNMRVVEVAGQISHREINVFHQHIGGISNKPSANISHGCRMLAKAVVHPRYTSTIEPSKWSKLFHLTLLF